MQSLVFLLFKDFHKVSHSLKVSHFIPFLCFSENTEQSPLLEMGGQTGRQTEAHKTQIQIIAHPDIQTLGQSHKPGFRQAQIQT